MIGIGVNIRPFISKVARAAADYYNRVIADSGVSESLDCVNTEMSNIDGINLLDQASLVMIPSGYKGGKLYAEIPTNGNGDLTWTRGGDGFRTNASGLIQRVPWNLLQQSNAFTTSPWSFVGTPTLTANYATNPVTGANDAWRFQSANNSQRVAQVFNGSLHTFSLYAKGTGTLTLRDSTSNYVQDVTLNSSWQRVSLYIPAAFTNVQITSNGGCDATIYGAQLVEGTTAQTYLPTTDRLNFPRLDYTYGSCPAVLLEPQRTNLVQRSEEFDNAYWSKYLATVTANTATSPDGTTNADLVYPSSTGPLSGQLFRQISSGISSGNVVTISAFVKASGKNFAYLSQIQNSFSPDAYFNLTTGAITNISSGVTASMTQLTNSWWRISITSTAGAGLYYAVIGSTDSAGSNINTASGTNGILVYGYQVEVGAYPTTYIQTTSATATRVADSFSRNNIYTNGLISASGGTWFVELRGNVAYVRDGALLFGVGDTGLTNSLVLISASASSSRLAIRKYISGSATTLYTTTTDTTKIAIKWDGTSADIFANGTKVVSATAFTPTNMENLTTSGAGVPVFIQQMALYPSPLSDTDCTTLTTL